MALQYSTSVNNARLDSIESTIGTSPKLRLLTGTQPANCGTAQSGTLLVEIALPSDWMAAASAGSKAKLGTWSGTATGTGTAGYFRIVDSAGTTCHMQGDITATGSGGTMTVDNTSVATNQTVTVSTFSLTAANA